MSGLDWLAVSSQVRSRVTERNITTAELARVTALSQTTIRQIRKGTGTHHGHALIALSAALGWLPQYLREIAVGKQPSVPAAPWPVSRGN